MFSVFQNYIELLNTARARARVCVCVCVRACVRKKFFLNIKSVVHIDNAALRQKKNVTSFYIYMLRRLSRRWD